MMQPLTLGVDFGATKIVTAVYGSEANNCVAEIVLDPENCRLSASCVAFTEKERLLRQTAVFQGTSNPENTIFGRGIIFHG